MNIFDFENADIGKLAIHIRESLWGEDIQAVAVNMPSAADVTLVHGGGHLVGVALLNPNNATGVAALCDGPSASQRFIALQSIAPSAAVPGESVVVDTTVPLAANGVFTSGTIVPGVNETVTYSWTSDQSGSPQVQVFDGTAWLPIAFGTAGNGGSVSATLLAGNSYRVVYTNGATLQATFRLVHTIAATSPPPGDGVWFATWPNGGLPIVTGLVIADLLAATRFVGQVFVRRAKARR